MKEVFVFDVDGTLTEPRKKIDSEFKDFMLKFIENNDVYLVTGSDRLKTFEQLGFELYEACKGVWQCNGNEFWEGSKRGPKNDFKADYEFTKFLKNVVVSSRYPIKTGSHIEERTGMLNFSTVGRGATLEQREEYYKWDLKYHERNLLCEQINHEYPKLLASVGGQISIDVAPRSNNKSQIADILNKQYGHIHFYGDKMEYGGNDYPLATTITIGNMGTAYPVESYKQTWEVLKQL
jgi:phosphomannomutase